MRKGIAVSPGVAVGTAYCIHEIFVDPDAKRLEDREITAELARYEAARDRVSHELQVLQQKVSLQVGREAAAIFAAHEAILRDAAFTNRVRGWIVNDRLTAQAALQQLLDDYTRLFSRTNDEYLKERLGDVRDVVIRLSAYLSDVLKPDSTVLRGPLIVVADELVPSQAVALGDAEVQAIVTQRGSQTSHAAIIARSRGIPAVAGVKGILRHVKSGDTIVVDGRSGHVGINPTPEVLSAYLKLEREFFLLKDQLVENRDQPARTLDNQPISLQANINSLADAETAVAMGADGVGLYRTEYLYLTHPDVPDEEEQLAIYRRIVEASPRHSVTIRTLDIGGDKTVPYLGHTHQEANPFLGWRSIRLSFEHPEFFTTQIRAVLRAAAGLSPDHGEVRLLFPMITTLEEMRRVRSLVHRVQRALQKQGFDYGHVPIGMMLEVPAAAVSLEDIIGVVDFVSIGSNDLVQYLMAADRDNPKVNHLCQPLSPPVLRVLRAAIRSCNQAHKSVTLCGEMAGQPQAFVLLLGMGLCQFSMSPAFVPRMKKLASLITLTQAQAMLTHVLQLKTTAEIKRYMSAQIAKLAPDFGMLDSA
jgi:phosphotransferase system enzyme I (PtsI)